MSVKDAVRLTASLKEWLQSHYGAKARSEDGWQLAALTLQALDDGSLSREEYKRLIAEETSADSNVVE